jgi:hypothetical protein
MLIMDLTEEKKFDICWNKIEVYFNKINILIKQNVFLFQLLFK